MPEFLKEIFTTYWSQTILLIGSVGYLLKLTFDLRSKKVELKYSLFEQNRINSIMKFITAYLELEQNYKMIPEGRIKLEEITTDSFDEMFLKKNAEIYSSYFYLKLYLEPLELVRYSELVTEMRGISTEIKNAYIKFDIEEKSKIELDLKSYIVDKIASNNRNFKAIAELFRKYSNKPHALKL